MRFLVFLEGASGVRGFQVSSEDGERLHAFGTGAEFAWTALRTAEIARDFGVAGAIAGLGSFSSASVRSVRNSRLLAQSGESIAVIDLELTRTTADIETQLQENEWASSVEENESQRPNVGSSEHETLPPRPGARSGTPTPSPPNAAPTQAPALVPAAPPVQAVPPRPFQGLPAIAGRAVPRPGPAIPGTAPRIVTSAAPTSTRSGRPPLPAARPLSSNTAATESSSEPHRAAVALPLDELTVARREETPGASSALLTGSLATFALPDLLEFLRVGQRTGTLVCASDAGLGAIHIKRGRITGAASPGVPSIGDWLVQRGALTQEKLHEALRHHTQSGAKTQLGATLISHKLISHDTLQEALVFHVGAVLRKLMTWETGAFTFDPASADAAAVAVDVDIDPQAVLLNIFKEMDDSQRA